MRLIEACKLLNAVTPFIVTNKEGEYLVEVPYWDKGKWTNDITLATIFHTLYDLELFTKYWPQFERKELK